MSRGVGQQVRRLIRAVKSLPDMILMCDELAQQR